MLTTQSTTPVANESMRSLAIQYLLKHAPEILASQREDGAFFPYPEWKIPSRYHQYCLYPLAWLYQEPEAGSWYRNPKVLHAVRASAVYTIKQLGEDGSFPIHSRGDTFGSGLDEWWTYFFLQTWLLIRSELAPAESARWEQALRCSVSGCAAHVTRELNDPNFAYGRNEVHNHYVWYALAIYLTGRELKEQAWTDLGKRAMDRLVAEQDADGYWPENAGPIPAYSAVAAAAVSLYAIASNDSAAWQATEKSLAFARAFTYPDGSMIETIDGRVRHKGKTMAIMPPGYGRWPRGQAYLQHQVACLLREPFGDHFQEYSFFTDVARYATAEVANFESCPTVSVLPSGKGSVVREKGWICIANAFLAKPNPENRWVLDRQSHLSLWHQTTGLITGGGGSKNQPEFSTLVLENSDGTARQYMANQAVITSTDRSGITTQLRFEDQSVSLRTQLVNTHQTTIETLWHGNGKESMRMVLQLPVRILAGQKLRVDGQEYVLGSELLELQVKNEIMFDQWRMQCTGASLRWPVHPFYSYKLSGQSNLSAAYGLLRLPLTVAVPQRVVVHIASD